MPRWKNLRLPHARPCPASTGSRRWAVVWPTTPANPFETRGRPPVRARAPLRKLHGNRRAPTLRAASLWRSSGNERRRCEAMRRDRRRPMLDRAARFLHAVAKPHQSPRTLPQHLRKYWHQKGFTPGCQIPGYCRSLDVGEASRGCRTTHRRTWWAARFFGGEVCVGHPLLVQVSGEIPSAGSAAPRGAFLRTGCCCPRSVLR